MSKKGQKLLLQKHIQNGMEMNIWVNEIVKSMDEDITKKEKKIINSLKRWLTSMTVSHCFHFHIQSCMLRTSYMKC